MQGENDRRRPIAVLRRRKPSRAMMVDRLGMDPARIERLRSPERLEYFDPS